MGRDVNLSKLFNPRSIAIVGASPQEYSAGAAVLATLNTVGFTGTVYPVNPRYTEVAELTCYSSLAEVPGPIDAAFIALGAEAAVPVVREAAELGVRAVEYHAGGFADGGRRGKALQAELVALVEEFGLALCGPNNMGLLNMHDRTGLWPLPPAGVDAGPIAIIAQSGSAAMVLAEDPKRLGVAYIVTTGNEASLTAADYLDYVVRDERVELVLLFLEAIKDPAGFAAAAGEAAARGTTLLAVRVGDSEVAREAIVAHTNALAVNDRVVDAFLRECGVVRVRDFDELLETAHLFRANPAPPKTPGVVVLTMSGGEAALAGDLASAAGISLPALRKTTREGLRRDLAAFSAPGNPLDAWGTGWDLGRFTLAVERLLREPGVSTIVAALDAPASGGCDAHIARQVTRLFTSLAPETETRFVIVNNSAATGTDAELVSLAADLGVPCLAGLAPGLAAVGHWASHVPASSTRQPVRLRRAPRELRGRVARGDIHGLETARLLDAAGIAMVGATEVGSAREAVREAERLGFPVVMKAHGRHLIHKTEEGLVKLMLTDAKAVRAAYGELGRRIEELRPELPGISVESQERGLELVIGVRNDPQFGLVTMAGLGGIHVELVREVSVRVGRVDRRVAREMFAETLAGAFLDGIRGGPPLDADAAGRAVAALWSLAASLRGELESVEVNPLLVRERGRGVVGVDAVLVPVTGITT